MSIFTDIRDSLEIKTREIVNKITFIKPKLALAGIDVGVDLNAEVDAALKVILDDSFLKVIDRAVFALDSSIDKASKELEELAQKIFDNLLELEKELEKLVDNFFDKISNAIQDIKANLVDPIVDSIFKLEEQIFEDINQVIDKIFDFFTGTIQEFKNDLFRIFNPFPNPFDSCRQQYGLALTPTGRLTHVDLFNLFECNQLRRLNDGNTVVKEIQETYALLQLESFKMTCLGRGSPAFQELYMRKWLKYGQLFEIWQEFKEDMTPQEAFDEAIRRLNQARDEYNSKVAEINRAQTTADDGVNRANNAQNTANDGVNRANNAQNTANDGVNRANNAQNTADSALNMANQVNARTQKISFDGNSTLIDAGGKFLAIQGDGNVVIRRDNGQVLFDTGTSG